MAYNALPTPEWYAANLEPVTQDKSFRHLTFRIGLRLSEPQAKDVDEMLLQELSLSGVGLDNSLTEQATRKNINEAVSRLYEKQENLYGWGAINRVVVNTYLWHGLTNKWDLKKQKMTEQAQPEGDSVPRTLAQVHRARASAGPVPISPAPSATPPKHLNNSTPLAECHHGVLKIKGHTLLARPWLSSPAILGKRPRGSAEGNSADVDDGTSEVKKPRTEVNSNEHSEVGKLLLPLCILLINSLIHHRPRKPYSKSSSLCETICGSREPRGGWS
jgi:hypothetical protein